MLWIPIFCDAPGRFSITIAWPSNFDASGATMRATMSTGPPGAVGRTRRTGLAGKLCAWPAIAYAKPQASAATARRPARPNVGGFVMDALPTSCDDSEDDEPFPHSRQLPGEPGGRSSVPPAATGLSVHCGFPNQVGGTGIASPDMRPWVLSLAAL